MGGDELRAIFFLKSPRGTDLALKQAYQRRVIGTPRR
jgi:hypothetical protein